MHTEIRGDLLFGYRFVWHGTLPAKKRTRVTGKDAEKTDVNLFFFLFSGIGVRPQKPANTTRNAFLTITGYLTGIRLLFP